MLSEDIPTDSLTTIASRLEDKGYIILPQVLGETVNRSLLAYFHTLNSQEFRPATIGRQQEQTLNTTIRQDRICWLERGPEALEAYFAWLETLRRMLNQRLFLGLREFECHYAFYPAGAFYQQHLDAFRGKPNRIVSSILYLNPDWKPQDGGELLLYAIDTDPQTGQNILLEKILPEFGTMVLFLSEEFPHEVLPTKAPRVSLTGWFRL